MVITLAHGFAPLKDLTTEAMFDARHRAGRVALRDVKWLGFACS